LFPYTTLFRSVIRRLNETGIPAPSTGKVIYADPTRTPRWGHGQLRRVLTDWTLAFFCCLTLVHTENASRQEDNRSIWPPPGRPSLAGCVRVHNGVDAPHQPEHAMVPGRGRGSNATAKTPKRGRQRQTTSLSLRT